MLIHSKNSKIALLIALFAVVVLTVGAVVLKTKRHQPPFTPQEAATLRRDFAIACATNKAKSTDALLVDVANQQKNPYLRSVMLQVRDRVNAGYSIAASLAQSPDVFGPYYVSVADQAEHAKSRAEGIRIITELEH